MFGAQRIQIRKLKVHVNSPASSVAQLIIYNDEKQGGAEKTIAPSC